VAGVSPRLFERPMAGNRHDLRYRTFGLGERRRGVASQAVRAAFLGADLGGRYSDHLTEAVRAIALAVAGRENEIRAAFGALKDGP
jgi:hypothetical protein